MRSSSVGWPTSLGKAAAAVANVAVTSSGFIVAGAGYAGRDGRAFGGGAAAACRSRGI